MPSDNPEAIQHAADKRASAVNTSFVPRDTPADAGIVPAPSSAQAWIGKTLGKYEVLGLLGQGGMGIVLKAYDPLIERDVAIKVLADELSRDETALARFLAEAKAAGRLSHPNVCSIYEIDQEGEVTFLVMEYIAGGSLENLLEQHGACSVLDATQMMIEACKGIAAAHAAGLIHRDIKPANFMRGSGGEIKVMDFGLAKTAGRKHQLTQTGLVVGTPFFMSPEQCEAKTVDTRSDIYSLGATYYSLLTGQFPFQQSDSVPRIMYNHCFGPIPEPRDIVPTLPPACSRIVARSMAKAPDDRYQTVGALLADLQAVAAARSGQAVVLPSEGRMQSRISTTTMAPVSAKAVGRKPLRAALGVSAGLAIVLALALFLWQPWRTLAPVVAPAVEPIKVGVLHSLTGTMANSSLVVVDATLLAIEEVNRAGGVLGRPIKPVVADGQSDEPTFTREAERLIHKDQVCTIFGCWTSSSRKAVKPVVEDNDHLLMYPLQYEGIEASPCIVYLGAAPNQQILPAIDWAVGTLGKKSFFLVGSDYVFPRTANAIIKDRLTSMGAQLAGEMYLPMGSTDAKHVVDAIVAAKPEMILNTINGDSNTAFFRELRQAGVKSTAIPTMSFSVSEQDLRSLGAADTQGDYAAWTYFQSLNTPENKEFVRRIHEKYPQRRITDPMECAYVSVKLWALAVNEARSLEPKKIRRALLNQRLSAPDGKVRIDADTQHCWKTPRIGQIQESGQFKIVWSAADAIAPDPYPPSRSTDAWRAFLHDLHAGWGGRWSAPLR